MFMPMKPTVDQFNRDRGGSRAELDAILAHYCVQPIR
jgi:hypothetical protein